MSAPVALVTGASRGIGAACAVALAEVGYDVALSARTVKEGTGVLDGDLAGDRPDAPIAGSLEATAAAVNARGRRALPVAMDVADLSSVEAAVDRVIDGWGGVDVVVNVAHYRGPGYDAGLLGTPLHVFEKVLTGDVLAPLLILQKVLPGMVARGSGTIVQMSSSVAARNPPGPPGRGGWGLPYAVGKGGFDRIAGVLAAELSEHRILVYNVEPGLVAYGRRLAEQQQRYPWAEIRSPEPIGAAVAWLVTHPDEAAPLRDKRIHLPQIADRYCS
ncbi:MAG TPA: SDR family oxidoreductase [Acidimicrobiales bacterium]|nr:SDR family oxidoreductase [Acidimicrobiales bacterium]